MRHDRSDAGGDSTGRALLNKGRYVVLSACTVLVIAQLTHEPLYSTPPQRAHPHSASPFIFAAPHPAVQRGTSRTSRTCSARATLHCVEAAAVPQQRKHRRTGREREDPQQPGTPRYKNQLLLPLLFSKCRLAFYVRIRLSSLRRFHCCDIKHAALLRFKYEKRRILTNPKSSRGVALGHARWVLKRAANISGGGASW